MSSANYQRIPASLAYVAESLHSSTSSQGLRDSDADYQNLPDTLCAIAIDFPEDSEPIVRPPPKVKRSKREVTRLDCDGLCTYLEERIDIWKENREAFNENLKRNHISGDIFFDLSVDVLKEIGFTPGMAIRIDNLRKTTNARHSSYERGAPPVLFREIELCKRKFSRNENKWLKWDEGSFKMAVCIPSFNETWHEIEATARNVISYAQTAEPSISLKLILIQDGYLKSDVKCSNCKAEIKKSPHNRCQQCKGYVLCTACFSFRRTFHTDTHTFADDSSLVQPCFRDKLHEWGLRPGHQVRMDHTYFLYPTITVVDDEQTRSVEALVIVKGSNRYKFNSHAWFFSVCHHLQPEFIFLTDAGTLFPQGCLDGLMEKITSDDTIMGVTARQRAMGPQDILNSSSGPWQRRVNWYLSPAMLQAFEFEATFILNISLFNLAGALPVLPGPCQLLRWDQFEQVVVGPYLEKMEGTDDDTLLDYQVRLAEDRVASTLCVSSGMRTHYVPYTTFLYEPEMEFASLLRQRRRWMNGTTAAFFFLLSPSGKRLLRRVGGSRERTLRFLWVLQLWQISSMCIGPAAFAIAAYIASEYLFEPTTPPYGWTQPPYLLFSETWIGGWLFFHGLWVLRATMSSKGLFDMWHCRFQYFINIILMAVINYALFHSLFTVFSWVHGVFLFFFLFPPLLSLRWSAASATLYLKFLPVFLLSISFYVNAIVGYSFARAWDISWGTKETARDKKADAKIPVFKRNTRLFNLLVFLANVGICAGFFYHYRTEDPLVDDLSDTFIAGTLYFLLFFPLLPQVLGCLFSVFRQPFEACCPPKPPAGIV